MNENDEQKINSIWFPCVHVLLYCSVGLQFKTANKSYMRDNGQKDTPDVNFYVGKDSNNYKYTAPNKSGTYVHTYVYIALSTHFFTKN